MEAHIQQPVQPQIQPPPGSSGQSQPRPQSQTQQPVQPQIQPPPGPSGQAQPRPRPPSQTQPVQPQQQAKTPGAMNYVESINYFVGKGKINRAAIFDDGGKPLAETPDLQVPQQDARSIIQCVGVPINVYERANFGLFIGNIRYICFKVDNRTMVGLTKEELFVAHKCDNVLILAFIPIVTDTNVSCLGEVWSFAQELKTHMEVTQFVE